MKDILDREIKVGDIVAHGTRSGNSGNLNVKIIADIRHKIDERWGRRREITQCKVINYTHYNNEYKKGGSGWSEGYGMLIVNESIPKDLKEFLQSLL